MREVTLTNDDLAKKTNTIEAKVEGQNEEIQQLFNYLRQLIGGNEKRSAIGFKTTANP